MATSTPASQVLCAIDVTNLSPPTKKTKKQKSLLDNYTKQPIDTDIDPHPGQPQADLSRTLRKIVVLQTTTGSRKRTIGLTNNGGGFGGGLKSATEEEQEEGVKVIPSIATNTFINDLNKPPTPLKEELHFELSDVTESEESKCASLKVKARKGHDTMGHGDPDNYSRDGDEKTWEPDSNAYYKVLQFRLAMSSAGVKEEDWGKLTITYVTPNPDGTNQGERSGWVMLCDDCNTTFDPWSAHTPVSGTWAKEDFVGAFQYSKIKKHLGICDDTSETCRCGCKFDIPGLTKLLGDKKQATAHVSKATKDYVKEAEDYKAAFGDLLVPRDKNRGKWSKKRCSQLHFKLYNIKRGNSWVTRAQRDRLIAIGVPKTSNFSILEE